MRARDPNFYLSSIPLSPSRYLRPVYEHRSVGPACNLPQCLTDRSTTTRFHFPTPTYHRHKSKDLSPFTLPQFARMDQPQRLNYHRAKLLSDLKAKQAELIAKTSVTKRRKSLIKDLSQRFRVTFTKEEKVNKSEMELTETALRKVNWRVSDVSCRKIQKSWREVRMKKVRQELDLRATLAAKRIQRFYRRHLLNRKLTSLQSSAALTIQRYWRGYQYPLHSVRQAYSPTLTKHRLMRSLSSLQSFRMTVLKRSGLVIWYYWKKYRERKRNTQKMQVTMELLPLTAIQEDSLYTSGNADVSRSMEVTGSPRSPKKSEDFSFHSLESSPILPKGRQFPLKAARH